MSGGNRTRSNFGCVRRIDRDKYRVLWEGPRIDGKRNRKSKIINGTRRDAEDFLASIRLSPGSLMTYRQLHMIVERDDAGLSLNTLAEYDFAWRRLEPYIADDEVSSTTPSQAERILRQMGSPSAQRKVLRYWRKLCNRAIHEGVIDRNPIDRYVRVDREKRRPKRLLRADEVASWMDAIRGIKYEPLLLLELGGGLSPEEACALDWEDIQRLDRSGKTYALVSVSKALTSVKGRKVLKDTKNDYRMRQMVVGNPFAERVLELAGEGPICPNGLPRNMRCPEQCYTSPVTISHNWKAWCVGNGIEYVSQANMRSSYATLQGEAGTPDSIVSGAMGHSDGTTKRRWYQGVTTAALCEAADRLETYLGKMLLNAPSYSG